MIKTLKAITAAVETLTEDGHLPEPGSVVVTGTGAMLFPELPGAPISGLLVWALHLEGTVKYQAECVFRNGSAVVTGVTASGTLDGIDVNISATTYRPMAKLADQLERVKIDVTEMDLRELAAPEEVLGQLS